MIQIPELEESTEDTREILAAEIKDLRASQLGEKNIIPEMQNRLHSHNEG